MAVSGFSICCSSWLRSLERVLRPHCFFDARLPLVFQFERCGIFLLQDFARLVRGHSTCLQNGSDFDFVCQSSFATVLCLVAQFRYL